MKTCVFAGSFDPITTGHYQTVEKCLKLFDKVVIAVGVNPEKKPYFTLDERIEIIKKAFDGEKNVEVKAFSGLLVDFMKENGYTVYVRGIRNGEDYAFENNMAIYNSDMYPDLITIFIPSEINTSYVSSTAVRTVIELKGDYAQYIPEKAREFVKLLINKK